MRRQVEAHLEPGETWQGAAQEAGGSWWVVTDRALLVVASSDGAPTRVPRGEIVEVRPSASGSLYVRTLEHGYLVGSFPPTSRMPGLLSGS